MLKRKNRLKKRKEYKYIFRKGKRLGEKNLLLIYIPTKLEEYKIGLSITKKIGNAVIRNKVSRRIKSILREKSDDISNRFNYIFIAKKGIEAIEYSQIKKQIESLLKKANERHF